MLKLNAQTVQKNGMGVAWMLAHNGKEIPVKDVADADAVLKKITSVFKPVYTSTSHCD